MGTYLITYDLRKPGQDYTSLIKEIKSLDPYDWVKPCESTWIVTTALSVDSIINRLNALDLTDKVLVISVSSPWWTAGMSNEVINALKRKIK